MAVAYTGSTFLPPLMGVIATKTSMILFPFLVLFFLVAMLLSAEKVNIVLGKRKQAGN
ncbi:hypothetical protein D3C74_271850 [compost metagenome]